MKNSSTLRAAVALFDARTGCHFSRLPEILPHDLAAMEQLCEPDSYNLPALGAFFACAQLSPTLAGWQGDTEPAESEVAHD